jgi:hypothetical protein
MSQESEVRSQKSEVRSQKSEARSQKPEAGVRSRKICKTSFPRPLDSDFNLGLLLKF